MVQTPTIATGSGHPPHPEAQPPAGLRGREAPWTAVYLFAALVYLYLIFFIPPFTPVHLPGDGPIYLNDAKRMLAGEVLYRDFFQFSTPGTDLVYYGLFKLFGPRLWIPNAVLLLIGLAFAWLSVLISRQVMGPRLAYLPGAAFLTVGFGRFPEATHHWFSGLAIVAALAVLIKKRTPLRIALAGALSGAAVCFTQPRGVMALLGFGIFVVWEWRRSKSGWRALLKGEACLFGAFFATLAMVNAYFIWKAGFHQFWYCTVVFGLKYFPAQATYNTFRVFTEPLPAIPPWRNLLLAKSWFFIFSFIPLIYILFFVRYRREARRRPQVPWARLMLLAMVGLFLFLSVAPAPSLLRTYAGALPGFILLGWFLDWPNRLHQVLAGLLVAVTVLAAATGIRRTQFAWKGILQTSQGSLAILEPEAYNEYAWLSRRTQPSQYFFDAARGQLYFYLDLRNPSHVPFITNTGYTRPQQVQDVIEGLEEHQVRYVLWESDMLDSYPSRERPPADHLGPLRAYLRFHYHVARTFSGWLLLWERNE